MRAGRSSYCAWKEKKLYGICHKSMRKKVLMVSAVHRSARVFGCFFLLWKFWIAIFVRFFVFWLIDLMLKVVRKVKLSRIFVQWFSPLHISDSPLPLWSVPNIETKVTGCWLKSRFSAGVGAMCVNSESYNSAEPGEKATAAPQPCIAHLVASDTAILPTLQFLIHLKTIIAYICIYLHMHASICLVFWTRGHLLPGLMCLMAKVTEIHCQHLAGTRNTRYSLRSVGSAPLAPTQNAFCSQKLRAGRGVMYVPILFYISTLWVTLFKNPRISSYLCTNEDGKNVLGAWELGQRNII